MADRPTTAAIILELEKTQKHMDSLIKFYKSLEKILKGSAKSSAINVRKQIERLRDYYIGDLIKHMKKLREKAKREAIKGIEEAKRREEEARKLRGQAGKLRKGTEKLKRI